MDLTRDVFWPMRRIQRGKEVINIRKGGIIIIGHRIKAGRGVNPKWVRKSETKLNVP